jgi:OOP family OmpA-OmpF porin
MSMENDVLRIQSFMRIVPAVFAAALAFTPVMAFAEDADGCMDNLIVGRYAGSTIAYCKVREFDELVFMTTASDYGALWARNGAKDRSAPEFLKQQGRASEIRYVLPVDRSSLEVLANYEANLKSQGFQTIFSCSDQECLVGKMVDTYLLGDLLDPTNGISTAYFDHGRYLFAKREQPEGTVYASVIVGESKYNAVAFLRILEAKGMETEKIVAPAPEDLSASLDNGGSANLYGILFDSDQDRVKTESKAALDEIAKVLTAKPLLRLKIIGHTDNVGGEAYNLDLSTRRAANVSAALVGGYSIDPERLSFEGAGLSRPIDSNDTEEGRAKNRRVELVAQ